MTDDVGCSTSEGTGTTAVVPNVPTFTNMGVDTDDATAVVHVLVRLVGLTATCKFK